LTRKILFISGSIGLGHVMRDLEIAKELRRLEPDLELLWLADDPARSVIENAGERLAPETTQVSYGTKAIEAAAKDFRTNMVMTGVDMMQDSAINAQVCSRVVEREKIELVVGDETFDLLDVMQMDRNLLKGVRLVLITDFLGFEVMTENPVERSYVNYANGLWYKLLKDRELLAKTIFIGEPEDLPDRSWGPSMPTFRELSKDVDFVGYILSFEPSALIEREALRTELGYGQVPLIICTVGGTAAGKELLDLCAKSLPFIHHSIPTAKMVLVGGPRIDPSTIMGTEGAIVRGFVPDLFKHLAVCDLAITTAGGTTSLELIALGKPFIYFPLEQHFEQVVHVTGANRRRGAKLCMSYSLTTPELLADAVIDNLGSKVEYAPLPLDGARKAAALINEVMQSLKRPPR
jgi:UDP:flavonoid glycosyltransferase YjiC (YdhE family)